MACAVTRLTPMGEFETKHQMRESLLIEWHSTLQSRSRDLYNLCQRERMLFKVERLMCHTLIFLNMYSKMPRRALEDLLKG